MQQSFLSKTSLQTPAFKKIPAADMMTFSYPAFSDKLTSNSAFVPAEIEESPLSGANPKFFFWKELFFGIEDEANSFQERSRKKIVPQTQRRRKHWPS